MKYKNLIINIIKFFICFFLFFYRNIFIVPIIRILKINTKNISTTTEMILSTIASIILCIVTFLIYRKEIIKEWKIFKNNMSNNIDTGIKYWIYGLIAMVISNLLINIIFKGGQATNEQEVQKLIESSPMIMLFTAGIIGPINEELLFRKGIKNIFSNKYLFILISSLLFGYLHISDFNSIDQFLYIIPYSSLGIVFALSYYKTNTIFTSITTHMLHNTILTLLSILI